MNGAEALKVIDLVALCWPSRFTRHTDARAQGIIWQRVLDGVTFREVEAVLLDMVACGRVHPPDLPELVGSVLDLRERATGVYPPGVDEALAEVTHYVTRRGLHRGPPDTWSHPAVAAAVKAFTWAELCGGGDTIRAHFIRAYTEARDRHHARQRRSPQMTAMLGQAAVGALPASTPHRL